MLLVGDGSEGERLLTRKPYDPRDYAPPKDRIDAIRTMQGFNVGELLEMRDGPFASGYFSDKVQRDGRSWWRLCHVLEEWCLLIEDSDEPLAYVTIKALPPDEARDVSKSYDARRPGRVVDPP